MCTQIATCHAKNSMHGAIVKEIELDFHLFALYELLLQTIDHILSKSELRGSNVEVTIGMFIQRGFWISLVCITSLIQLSLIQSVVA